MKINEIVFLLEDRLDFLRNKYEDEITTSIFERLLNNDPTKKKIYLQWLIKNYINNTNKDRFLEDLYKTKEDLVVFTKLKQQNKIQQKDINQIKYENLYDIIKPHMKDLTSGKEIKKQELEKIKSQIKVVYDGAEGKILIPFTEKASCFLGRQTRWCTASTESKNYFNYYNKKGKLYVILPKDGRKFQFHFQELQLMDEQDKEVNFELFDKKYPWVFNNIKFTEEEQLKVVKKDVYAIQYIKNPSEEVQLTAVSQNGHAIEFIKNPSEKVQLTAAKQDGYIIGYIKNPSEKVQIVAVSQNGYVIKRIKNPSEEVQLAAVNQDGYAIKHIKNPSEKVQMAAVQQNNYSIIDIKNPSEEVQLAAVNQNGYAIKRIKNPSERVQLAAVQQNSYSIIDIKNPSERVQLAVVSQNGKTIQYINNPSEKVQLTAVNQNRYAIYNIKPKSAITDKVRQLAEKLIRND